MTLAAIAVPPTPHGPFPNWCQSTRSDRDCGKKAHNLFFFLRNEPSGEKRDLGCSKGGPLGGEKSPTHD